MVQKPIAFHLALVLTMLGCGSERPLLEVYGNDISSYGAAVFVIARGVHLNDADVKVNGTPLVYVDKQGGYYTGPIAQVGTYDTLVLEVERGGVAVEGIGTVPARPSITSPAEGTTFAAGEDILVTWTSGSTPDRFDVIVEWPCGPVCGAGTRFSARGSDRSLTIHHQLLVAGKITLGVNAYNDGSLSGDYEPSADHPGMNIRNESPYVTISRDGPP